MRRGRIRSGFATDINVSCVMHPSDPSSARRSPGEAASILILLSFLTVTGRIESELLQGGLAGQVRHGKCAAADVSKWLQVRAVRRVHPRSGLDEPLLDRGRQLRLEAPRSHVRDKRRLEARFELPQLVKPFDGL
ncbi:hypothetical protein DLJ82_0241 [Rhizobium leguminosarum]|uniref:Uncharacterized protein n=1 Tax=Rhizobium leguminosarum TaxID=384 RepID=A0A2Z4Y9K2_RHILE|nr:hypothetical protein DLJ82_0241 [Rhizobium leguminosarum]